MFYIALVRGTRLTRGMTFIRIPPDPVSTAAGHDDIPKRTGRIQSFYCGKFSHRDLILSERSSRIIGLRYLSRFVVTFDISNDAIYLQEGLRFAAHHEADLSGMHITAAKNEIVVKLVAPDSPASRAGVIKGDVIQKIGNHPVEGSSMTRVRRMLEASDGRLITLELRRGSENVKLSLILTER